MPYLNFFLNDIYKYDLIAQNPDITMQSFQKINKIIIQYTFGAQTPKLLILKFTNVLRNMCTKSAQIEHYKNCIKICLTPKSQKLEEIVTKLIEMKGIHTNQEYDPNNPLAIKSPLEAKLKALYLLHSGTLQFNLYDVTKLTRQHKIYFDLSHWDFTFSLDLGVTQPKRKKSPKISAYKRIQKLTSYCDYQSFWAPGNEILHYLKLVDQPYETSDC